MSHSLYKCLFCPVSPASHGPGCFQGGNTHRAPGAGQAKPWEVPNTALSLVTSHGCHLAILFVKPESFLPFWIIQWDPFDSVGVLKLFSSALAALAGIHGYSIIFLLCHAMQPLFPCHLLTGSTVTVWSCLYIHIQLSSASSSCLFGSILPIPSGFVTHVRSRDWGKRGKEQGGAGGEMRWARGKSRDNSGVGEHGNIQREKAMIRTSREWQRWWHQRHGVVLILVMCSVKYSKDFWWGLQLETCTGSSFLPVLFTEIWTQRKRGESCLHVTHDWKALQGKPCSLGIVCPKSAHTDREWKAALSSAELIWRQSESCFKDAFRGH